MIALLCDVHVWDKKYLENDEEVQLLDW
jgi:hypothetical protein